MATWKRNLPSRIWLQERGVVVRDVTPDLDQFVIEQMVENWSRDAPVSKSAKLYEDEASLEDMKWLWCDLILPQRVSLVALAQDTPGAEMEPVGAERPPVVLGCNMLMVTSRADPVVPVFDLAKGAAFRKIFTHMGKFTKDVDIFEKFQVDHYLDAVGLSVDRRSRGQGIGELLLRARLEMCKVMQIPITKTVFTSAAAQKIAARVGFQLVKEMSYSEMKDESGNPAFPDLCDGVQTIQLRVLEIK